MKAMLIAAACLSSITLANAQPATTSPATPAVSTPKAEAPSAPVKGANSFTEAQARERLTEHGFISITGLAKDDDGIWRGKGTKGGTEHDLALDYQGNVFPK